MGYENNGRKECAHGGKLLALIKKKKGRKQNLCKQSRCVAVVFDCNSIATW